MRFNKIVFRLSMSVLAMLPVVAMAATNPQDKQANYNILLISLVGFMVILLLVIGMLANTLRLLSIVLKNKNREKATGGIAKTVVTLLVAAALVVPSLGFAAEAAPAADSVAAAAVRTGPVFIQGIPEMEFYTLVTVILIELGVIFALAFFVRLMLKLINEKPELAAAAKSVVKRSWFWDNFNQAVSVEKEKDILIDHDYDGIQELDNSLPPWWKYGFYLTIVIACIYLYRFHVSHDGMSQQEEFVAAMEKGEEDKKAYLANSANNIDENSVTMGDAGEIAAGKEIFVKNCAACHLADGGGIVGPNLTDDYWLHGGSIKDVFKSIKYGWQDKGMKSWKDDFSPKQLQQLASFVKSLKGTKPATPKAPQGDQYIEGSAAPKTAADGSKEGKVAIK